MIFVGKKFCVKFVVKIICFNENKCCFVSKLCAKAWVSYSKIQL